MIKVLSVFGTRPEALKMVPLILAMANQPQITSKVCVTAQHRDLLDQVLTPFNITPDYDLNIMAVGQTLTDVTTKVLQGLAPILADYQPDILLVHGDTTTTFAASLAAFYAQVKVGHVEAGLRSYDKYRPYPEEINRRLTTAIADLYFAPTENSRNNLLKENIPGGQIYITGNTVVDLTAHTTKADYIFSTPALNQLDFSQKIILVTAHRRENWGQPMEDICHSIKALVQAHKDVTVVWPVHPGRAVVEPVEAILKGQERVILTQPLDVFDMHNLMERATLILTDSGGLQEEAPSFNLPAIVLREVTERPEGKEAGTLVLVGTDKNAIYNEATRLLTDDAAYKKMASIPNPFGDGKASQRIVDAILESVKC